MKWYTKYLQVYEKPFSEAPQEIVEEVRNKLKLLQSDNPLVTVSLIGYNEEKHLLASLWSLSEMKCKYPIEIIGTDNDSKDQTATIYEATGIPYVIEHQHSCGHARLCGLKRAKGKYHINIDSDTMYPPHYVETMVDALERPGIVAVSSLWSYIPDKEHSWVGLKIYEYRTDYARQVGIRTDIRRGEDGSLALRLKEYGNIYFIRKRKARAVTGYGTISADGSLFNSFKVRAIYALKNIGRVFTRKKEYKDEDDNLIKS